MPGNDTAADRPGGQSPAGIPIENHFRMINSRYPTIRFGILTMGYYYFTTICYQNFILSYALSLFLTKFCKS